MFDEQAVGFLACLKKKTDAGKANWLRYPSAYPYPDNMFLKMYIDEQRSAVDPSSSYFYSCKNGAVFLLAFTDKNKDKRICVQPNLSFPLLELRSGPMTNRIAESIEKYLESEEAQPDSIYKFFWEVTEGVDPLDESEIANLDY